MSLFKLSKLIRPYLAWTPPAKFDLVLPSELKPVKQHLILPFAGPFAVLNVINIIPNYFPRVDKEFRANEPLLPTIKQAQAAP